jgi:hypothetical protein
MPVSTSSEWFEDDMLLLDEGALDEGALSFLGEGLAPGKTSSFSFTGNPKRQRHEGKWISPIPHNKTIPKVFKSESKDMPKLKGLPHVLNLSEC